MINPQQDLQQQPMQQQEPDKDVKIIKSLKIDRKYYSQILAKTDAKFTKLNRDRLNHLLINEIVSTHLKWISSDARMQIQVQDNYETTLTDINLKGKNPHIYEAMEDITAEYSTLFKTPDTLFNIEGDINTPDGYDSIYKAWILDKLYKFDVINAYQMGITKELWRGENILSHEWEVVKERKRVFIETIDKDGNQVIDAETNMPKKEWVIQESIEKEGVRVRAIEPNNFVFDVTKIGLFSGDMYEQDKFASSSCVKIERSWMSLNEIKRKYNLTDDELDGLKEVKKNKGLSKADREELDGLLNETTASPTTEQNQDDFTNRFFRRYINGDMIEILDYSGDIGIDGDEFYEDMHIVTAASKVVLKCESNPYTFCKYLWTPGLVDFYCKRGISKLVPAIEYNQFATDLMQAMKKQLKFAIGGSAYFVNKGTHIVDPPKEVEPCMFISIDDGLGNGSMPQEIESWKNLPIGDNYLKLMQDFIDKALGSQNSQLGNPEFNKMTATQADNISNNESLRQSKDILHYINMILLPSIKLQAKMYAENLMPDDIEYIKVNGEVKQVLDAIRTGKYSFSIGSVQTLSEKKSQRADMFSMFNTMSNPAFQQTYNIKECIEFGAEPSGIQNASRFLNQEDMQVKQMQAQLQQQQQQMQEMQQQHDIEKANLMNMPNIAQHKFINDFVAVAIDGDSKMPMSVKNMMMQSMGIQPTQEMLIQQQKVAEQQITKQQNAEKNAMRMQSGIQELI